MEIYYNVNTFGYFNIRKRDVLIVRKRKDVFEIYPIGENPGYINQDIYFTIYNRREENDCDMVRYIGKGVDKRCIRCNLSYELKSNEYFTIHKFLKKIGANSSCYAEFKLIPIE